MQDLFTHVHYFIKKCNNFYVLFHKKKFTALKLKKFRELYIKKTIMRKRVIKSMKMVLSSINKY